MTGTAKLVLAFHHAGEEDADVQRVCKGNPFLVGNAAHTCIGIGDATLLTLLSAPNYLDLIFVGLVLWALLEDGCA
jgi:hypothetical protein